jgi:hypothetical protein
MNYTLKEETYLKKTIFVLSLMLIMAVIAIPLQVSAKEQAKTSPPPLTLISPLTVFDPSYDYLEKGQGYLTDQGKQKVNIWGDTYGTVRVDKISVQLTLQRWTGSTWIDVYYGANVEESSAAYAYSSISNISVLSGYYYRTKSYHSVKKGSTTESGYRYSSSYLIS